MLKVLIVDDEATNLELLHHVIDWQALGFRVVGTALDGEEGLDVYERTRPDVILVDIRMPVMDGLAFIREIRRTDALVKLIILSAHADFEYARQAIEYGIHAYLLKPVNEHKLAEALLQAKRERESDLKAARSKAEHDYRLLLDWADCGEEERIAMPRLVDVGPVNLQNGFAVAMLACDPGEQESATTDASVVAEQLEQRLGPACIVMAKGVRTWVALCSAAPSGLPKLREHIMNFHRSNLGIGTGLALLCGISGVHAAVEAFRAAYIQAQTALDICFYDETASPVLYREQPPAPRLNAGELLMRSSVIIGNIQASSIHAVQKFIDETMVEFRQRRTCPEDVRRFCSEFAMLLSQELTRIDAGFSGVITARQIARLRTFRRFSPLAREMEVIVVKAGSAFRSVLENNKNYAVIRKANEYAALHFHEPTFTLGDAAEYVGLSKSHFSKLYKEHTGENYWDVVIRMKIELAKRLLRETNQTNYEIADRIGYSSEYHFARIFAKMTGLTTTQYRKLHRM